MPLRLPLLALAGLTALSACATPRQQCVSAATRDLTVLRQLIAESRATLDRGFAIDRRRERSFETGICGYIEGRAQICTRPVVDYRRTPVAVDLNAETAKLRSLEAKERELSARAARAVESCRARYPAS